MYRVLSSRSRARCKCSHDLESVGCEQLCICYLGNVCAEVLHALVVQASTADQRLSYRHMHAAGLDMQTLVGPLCNAAAE